MDHEIPWLTKEITNNEHNNWYCWLHFESNNLELANVTLWINKQNICNGIKLLYMKIFTHTFYVQQTLDDYLCSHLLIIHISINHFLFYWLQTVTLKNEFVK